MTASVKNIVETVERLRAKDRALIVERLLVGLEDAELDEQWKAEATRRRDKVRSGKVKPVEAAEVSRRIERLLAR